jgi:serine phosphatase RsbU (regulator of sigma subunit)
MALTIAKFKDHQMHVSAAGMPFTLVYRASTGQVEELELKGLPLGVLPDFPYQEKKLELNEDDTVLFLSDGFEEMFNQQNEILGDAKAKEHFEEAATSSPDEIIEHLKKAGMAWANGSAQRDDVTFVVVKIK